MKKKMRSAAAVVLGAALTGMILTGCGEGTQPRQETGQESQQETGQESQQETGQGSQQQTGQESQQTGQGSQQQTGQESQQGTGQETGQGTQQESVGEDTESETEGEKEGPATKYEDNFAVDSRAAKEFAEKVKAAAAKKDLEALAELTAFPVYVGLPDVGGVETKEDFLKLGGEAVFTEELLKSVETADIENFQPSKAGFSISDGGKANINFGVVDGVLAITGINY